MKETQNRMKAHRWLLILMFIFALGAVVACSDDEGDDNADTASENQSDNTVNTNPGPAETGSEEANENSASLSDPGSSTSFGDNNYNFGPAPEDVIRVELPPQTLAPGDADLLIELQMPNGYKLNSDAPQRIAISSSGDAINIPEEWVDYRQINPTTPYNISLTLSEGEATLVGEMQIYWCEAINESLCFTQDAEVTIPVVVQADAPSSEMIAAIPLVPPLIID